MADAIVNLLNCFQLRARVFQAGLLCQSASYDRQDHLGYLHVLKAGRALFEADGHAPMEFDQPVALLYLNPTRHSITPLQEGTELVCGSFLFGADLRNPVTRALTDVVVTCFADSPLLEPTINLLFAEVERQGSGHQAVLDRLLEVVIVQALADLIDSGKSTHGLMAGMAHPRLRQALAAVHERPQESWTVESMAEQAGMSRARFAATFRQVIGTTPLAYLGEWRVSLAMKLLAQGQSVPQVAQRVGYGSANAFARLFKSVVGTSPFRWQKSLNEGADKVPA